MQLLIGVKHGSLLQTCIHKPDTYYINNNIIKDIHIFHCPFTDASSDFVYATAATVSKIPNVILSFMNLQTTR